MDAPVSPAGLPAIGISAAREDTEEIASLPAMSVQDDGMAKLCPSLQKRWQLWA